MKIKISLTKSQSYIAKRKFLFIFWIPISEFDSLYELEQRLDKIYPNKELKIEYTNF